MPDTLRLKTLISISLADVRDKRTHLFAVERCIRQLRSLFEHRARVARFIEFPLAIAIESRG